MVLGVLPGVGAGGGCTWASSRTGLAEIPSREALRPRPIGAGGGCGSVSCHGKPTAHPLGRELHPAAKAAGAGFQVRWRVSAARRCRAVAPVVGRNALVQGASFAGSSESGTIAGDVSVRITGTGAGQPHSAGLRRRPCRSAPSETLPARWVSPDRCGRPSTRKQSPKRCCPASPRTQVLPCESALTA